MSLNVMAQIDFNGPNWECVLDDDFSSNSWDTWDSWRIRHPLYETQIENSHIYKNYVVGSSSYFSPSVKESIVFEPTTELIVSDTMNIIMRAADSIILKNDITIPIGAQMTLIVHE